MRLFPLMAILLLTCIISSAQQSKFQPPKKPAAQQKTPLPAADAWIPAWQHICMFDGVHQEMGAARIRKVIDDTNHRAEYELLGYDNEQRGMLFISDDNREVLSFAWFPPAPVEQIVTPPTIEEAKAVAARFAHAFLKNQPGIEAISGDGAYRQEGSMNIEVTYRYRDVEIRSLSVEVDVWGCVSAVFGLHTGEYTDHNVIANIPPSPGEVAIRAAILKYLANHGEPTAVISGLQRTLQYEKGKPVLTWQAWLMKPGKAPDGKKYPGYYYAMVSYREGSAACSVPAWKVVENYRYHDNTGIPAAVPEHLALTDLAWSSDGQSIYGWDWRVRWPQQPVWDPNIPASMVVVDAHTGAGAVYRPLVDVNAWIPYQYPCPSPDGRWLVACLERGEMLGIFDLRYNRCYAVAGEYSAKLGYQGRVAWSSDSSRFTFGGLSVVTVASKCGVPFADPSQQYHVGRDVIASEFLPGKNDELLAILVAADKGAELARLHLQADGGIAITPIKQLDKGAASLQVMADGAHALIGLPNGLVNVDLATGAAAPIPWLAENKLGKGMSLPAREFQWRVSLDGARLAFVALHDQDPVLCTANLADGSGLQMLPPEGLPMLLPRYFLQGRYATVPADAVPVSVWRTHYRVPFPQWPALMPPGGPWERMMRR